MWQLVTKMRSLQRELANDASSCRLFTCAVVNVYDGPHRDARCLHDNSHANQILRRTE